MSIKPPRPRPDGDSPPTAVRASKDVCVCIVTVWIAATDEPVAFRAAVRPVEEQDSLFFTDALSLAGYFAGLRRRSFDPAAPRPADPTAE